MAAEKAEREVKERKRKLKQDKKEAQIAAGTYMTKAEKEKARKIQARLENMKAAGIQIPSVGSAANPSLKQSDIFKKRQPPSTTTIITPNLQPIQLRKMERRTQMRMMMTKRK